MWIPLTPYQEDIIDEAAIEYGTSPREIIMRAVTMFLAIEDVKRQLDRERQKEGRRKARRQEKRERDADIP